MDLGIATDLSDVRFEGASGEPLFEKRAPPTPAMRRRFAAALVFCLLVHATIIYLLIRENGFFPSLIPAAQEIPIQIVIEPPPQAAKPRPPPVQNVLHEKSAHDAPRAASKKEVKRDAPDAASQSPRVAPPPKTVTPQAEEKKPKPAQHAAPKASAPVAKPPEAAAIDAAKPSPEQPAKKEARAETEAQPQNSAQSLDALLADIKPLPNYKIGGARYSPVGGGHAKTTYLSILYGIIKSHFIIPPRVRGSPLQVEGEIAFNLDGTGKVTFATVIRSSGLQALDAAALAAIRWSSPFPRPPMGLPVGLVYDYTALK